MPFESRLRAMNVTRFQDAPTTELHKVNPDAWSPMLPPVGYPGGRRPRLKLHWMQWVTYIIVIITCLTVLYGMLETYLFLSRLQDALASFADSFNHNLIGD